MRARWRRPVARSPAAQLQCGDRPVRLVRPGAVALTPDPARLRGDIQRILLAAAGAVAPRPLVERAVGRLDPDRSLLFIVAAGKAAWSMAAGLESLADRLTAGVVAGPRREGIDIPPPFEHFDAGHPAPNGASERAGRRSLDLAAASRDRGTLLVLLSGGASAMLAVPAGDLSLSAKGDTALALMRAGVAIDGLNCVRKHLSAIKGGRLAAAAARSITLAISDVHGPPMEDDPSVIGSGPTVADPTTYADALDVIARSGAAVPPEVVIHLQRGAAGQVEESPKAGDVRLGPAEYYVIANRHAAMDGGAEAARAAGYVVELLEPATAGEARDTAHAFAAAALGRIAQRRAQGIRRAICVIASGETTVTVRGDGTGGRNQEFALAAAPVLDSAARRGVFSVLASAGTDGIDGPTPAAGAIADWTTLARSRSHGCSIEAALARNASYECLLKLGDLIVWGPTGTNVGDIHVLLASD